MAADALFGGLPQPKGIPRDFVQVSYESQGEEEKKEDTEEQSLKGKEEGGQKRQNERWKEKFDCDEDVLEEERMKKRQKEYEESEVFNVGDVIVRLTTLMSRNTKVKKSVVMAQKLLKSGKVAEEEDCILFWYMLKAASSSEEKCLEQKDTRESFASLYRLSNAVLPEKLRSMQADASMVYLLEIWYIRFALRYEILYTDDSFTFARLLNYLCSDISRVSEKSEEDDVSVYTNSLDEIRKNHDCLANERITSHFLCLEAAHSRYHVPWTQSSTDKYTYLLADVVEQNQLSDRKNEVETLKKVVVDRKRGLAIKPIYSEKTSFEKDQESAAAKAFSIRRAVGSSGDRKAAQWLG